MSKNTIVKNNGQQMQVQTNLAKLFPYKKEIRQYQYTNSEYDNEDMEAGTVMGVIAATGKVVACKSDASDGSQYPIGVLSEDYSVEYGDTINVGIAIFDSEVRQDMLIFKKDGDDLDTVVSSRRFFEWLLLAGILPVSTTNCTNFDNELT
jgi:hypothetical protein